MLSMALAPLGYLSFIWAVLIISPYIRKKRKQ